MFRAVVCLLKPLLRFSHGQTVYEGQELNHAFGLCHYKHFLFWNEYRSGSIYKLDSTTGTVTLLRNERPPIFEIRMYDAQQQQGASEHATNGLFASPSIHGGLEICISREI